MGIRNIAHNLAGLAGNIANAPVAAVRKAYNNPKTTVAALAALGTLAAVGYANSEALNAYKQPALAMLNKGTDLAYKATHDLLAGFGLANLRTETDVGYLWNSTRQVNMFFNV